MIAKNEHRILWLPNEERMWDDEGGGSRNAAGVRIDSSNAHSVAAVFSCLRVIAETVASLPLHVLERTPGGGKRIARELPLYRQLHAQPNGWQTSFEWREQAVFHIGLWGDAFSELKAGQIVPLHPSRMKVERVENGKIRYKFREDKGTETIYSNEQILQIRGPSDDGINGMSIVEECKDAIALARACELHGARFFAAGARPGFVLSTDGNLNAEARESLRSQWDRRHGGVGNAHNTAVLTGGLKPYEIPQSSNSDAQFLELRRYQLEEIARLFRCPGHLLGIGAGSAQADIEFVQHTILPWLRRFESAFMRDLIDDDRYLVEFDVRGLMRGDPSSRASFMRSLWEIGALNTDEIRELENMDPVEGGDVRYRPLNMGTLGAPPSEGDVLAQQQPGSGIDGQAVEGGLAAAAGETVVPATPGEPAETSLSTAEVSSLLTVVKQITDGMLTVDAARAIIAAAFPVLSAARVETILQGVAVKQEEPAQAPAAPGAAAPAARSQSVESRALTISVDFDRTFAADPTLWGEFARKAVADGNTVVMISRRPEEDRQTVAETLGDYADAFSQVLLVGGETMKGDAAQAAGIEVDVWVDDSPQTITPAEPCDECEEDRGFCATGEGGGVDNSCGGSGGGSAPGGLKTPSKKHNVKLPKNKSKMSIDQGKQALSGLGYKVGKGATKKVGKGWVTVFSVTDSTGHKATLTADEIKGLAYDNQGGK
jgi:HK97 family phage portal protein